jgi:hypothetical protein
MRDEGKVDRTFPGRARERGEKQVTGNIRRPFGTFVKL